MKLKGRITSFFIMITLLLSISTPAFCSEGSFTYSSEAQVLNDLGLYKGISPNTFDPDLGAALNRETGVVMLLRMSGLEREALEMEDADTVLAKFSDAASVSDWAKKSVAYAVKKGLVKGNPDGTFGPKEALNGKAYSTLILRQLGYTPDYETAVSQLADKKGLTANEAKKFNAKELIKDDLVGITFGSLKAVDKDSKTVIDSLVDKKVVDADAAAKVGLITPAEKAYNSDVDYANMLNSKVVEVTFKDSINVVDKTKTIIKDSNGVEIEVDKVEFAPYSYDKKKILIYLNTDTSEGKLYTVDLNGKKSNFTGKQVDTVKPEVSEIKSIGEKLVSIEFSEPVKIDSAKIVINEKYGTKANLAISDIKYLSSNKIVLTTASQKASTLYGALIEKVFDFAGNEMDRDDDKTFVGKGISYKVEKINKIFRADNSDDIYVEFDQNLGLEALNVNHYSIDNNIGNPLKAKLIGKDDPIALTLPDTFSRTIILTLPVTYKSITYTISVKGLDNEYGILMDSEKVIQGTFLGIRKKAATTSKDTESSNANLQSLSISSGTLSPAYSESVISYTANIESTVESITVTAAKADSNAKIKINGFETVSGVASNPITMNTGNNTVTVAVYAQNGTTEKDYSILITKAAPLSGNADLQSLSISSGTLNTAFNNNVTSYTSNIESSVQTITVTAIKADSNATIKIDGSETVSGAASNPIGISTGNNTVTVAVYAQNGIEKDYTIVLTKAPKPVSAEVTNGGNNLITLNIEMDGILTGAAADPTAFTITATGADSTIEPLEVSINGNKITILSSGYPVPAHSTVEVNYNPTGTNDLTNGSKVSGFTGFHVNVNIPQ